MQSLNSALKGKFFSFDTDEFSYRTVLAFSLKTFNSEMMLFDD